MNRERAYVQLISKLLGVEFDAIWQRHKRLLVQRAVCWAIGIVAVLAALLEVWNTSRSVDVEMRLNEASLHNGNLPPLQDAVMTLTLDNETKTDTIRSLDATTIFKNIPHRFLNEEAHVTFSCPDFMPLDTTMTICRDMTIDIYRDQSVYGNVHFGLWNPVTESFIPNVKLEIDGHVATTDKNGQVTLFIPLENQRKTYQVKAGFPLYNDVITMPCGENDVIEKL
jgi:hypothetical protein